MEIKRKIAGITALCLAFTAGAAVSPRFTRAASVFGDINGDGFVNAKDASLILSYYSYLSTTDGEPVTLEEYVSNGGKAPTTTTSAVTTTSTVTTTAATTTSAAMTTQTSSSFDPNTYEWPEPAWGDADNTMSLFTVGDTLYLEELAKQCYFGDEIETYDNGTIILRLDPKKHFGKTSEMVYIPNTSIRVDYYNKNAYNISLEQNAADFKVNCHGKTLQLPKSEISLVVLTLVGDHGGFEDQLLEAGFTREY